MITSTFMDNNNSNNNNNDNNNNSLKMHFLFLSLRPKKDLETISKPDVSKVLMTLLMVLLMMLLLFWLQRYSILSVFLEVGPSLGSSSRVELFIRLEVNRLKARARSSLNFQSSNELFCRLEAGSEEFFKNFELRKIFLKF